MEATCTPASADEFLYMDACDESVRSIKVAGPPTPTASIFRRDAGYLPSPSPRKH